MREYLIVVIGPSGAGKSTFIKAMGFPPDSCYVTSQPMIEGLTKCGQPVNHDTIFALSEKWYVHDPYWQVPLILKALEGRRFLVVDGPRRLPEVRRLLEFRSAILVKILSSSQSRFSWLRQRKKISTRTLQEFDRLGQDEWQKMDLGQIMNLRANVTVVNSGTENQHKARGKRFGIALRLFSFLPRPILATVLRLAVW